MERDIAPHYAHPHPTASTHLCGVDLPNVPVPAEATRVEDGAAGAQQVVWKAVRRMIKRAIAGEPELEALYAAC